MSEVRKASEAQETPGLVLNWGLGYDVTLWVLDLVTRGRLRRVRQKTLALADLQPGERVLDVGCGTGTLALEAYERVGPTGHVGGVDPAPRQLARAQAKARRRGAAIDFERGVVERLPYPAQAFDVVLSTWMMHHLPDDLKGRGLQEIARVLKPGGRLLIVDAAGQGHIHMGVDGMALHDIAALMAQKGYAHVESGRIPLPRSLFLPPTGYILGKI